MRPPGRADAIANVEAVTPFRSTHIIWDEPDVALTEPPWARHVPKDLFRAQSSSSTLRLISGAWILKPLNNDFNVTHEETTGQQYVIRLSQWYADPTIVEVPLQRVLSELPGIGASGSVSATGDYYMTRRIPAGANWAPTLVTAATTPSFDTQHYPMDTLLEGPNSGSEIPWQGYIVKFAVPGAAMQNPDNILAFAFGGALVSGHGYGQFAVQFNGEGRARISEFIDGEWFEHVIWRYARPSEVVGQLHAIAIIPHAPNYIQFSNFANAPVSTRNLVLSEVAQNALHEQDTDSVQSYLHQCLNRHDFSVGGLNGDQLPPTGQGGLQLQVRRDLRLYWQVQRIAYPAAGLVTEYPFMVPFQLSTPPIPGGHKHILQIFENGWNIAKSMTDLTPQTSISMDVQDPDTLLSFPVDTEDYQYKGGTVTAQGWTLPGGLNKCQVVVALANSNPSPRYVSPAFYGYEARRNPDVTTIANGEKEAPVHDVAISGPDSPPDHETATVFIQDTGNALPTLRTRGKIPVRIETEYDETDSSKRAILFQGYSGRIEARRRHSTSPNYPSPNWHDLTCELLGKWERMQATYFLDFVNFMDATTAPAGVSSITKQEPWKVTDAIRFVLFRLGFLDSQLDIFDDPIQFFANPIANTTALAQPNPTDQYGNWLVTVARDYLNAFLVWDANAGTDGMWRLLRPPTPTTTPVWNFVTTPQPVGYLPHKSGAYGANTSPVLERNSLVEYVLPPEANVLYVTGSPKAFPNLKPGQRPTATFVNRKSVDFAGYTDADPTDLDYMPFVKEIFYVDPSIDDPDALCFVGRRLYNLACRGRKFARFRAELVLFAPSDPVYTVHTHRPLRIPDVVALDGTPYMVRGVHPVWRKSWMQMAEYELELLRTDLTYG